MCMQKIKEKWDIIVEKTQEISKEMPKKWDNLRKEIKNNPKQAIVGGVILLFAIVLLVLAFFGCCDKSKQDNKPKVAENVQKVVIEPVAEKVIEEDKTLSEETKEETTTDKASAIASEEEKVATKDLVEEATEAETSKVNTSEESTEDASVKEAEEETESEPEPEEEPEPEVVLEPKVLSFNADAEKDFLYQIYYTVDKESWFDEDHKMEFMGKAGKHTYKITISTDHIYRFRIDFGTNPGTVTLSDIEFTDTDKERINDYSNYLPHDIDDAVTNEDGSITIKSTLEDPYISFLKEIF